jgi:salicylate hydroxylase
VSRKPKVVIAGAGLGGLAAALSLLQRGLDVEIVEQAETLREVGAGVQVSANGTRVLYALGLRDRLERLAWEPTGKVLRLWQTGATWPLFDLAVESVRRYGYPYLTFHRADLHGALVAAVQAIKPNAIRLAVRCLGAAQDDGGAALRLADGTAVEGDAAIGADGVHSAVRQSLFGPDAPQFTGLIAWRGVLPRACLPPHMHQALATNWVGPNGHVVHYFLRGGELLNFVGIRERDDWQEESWIAAGSRDELAADFTGWHDDIQSLIRGIETPYKWALKIRSPMSCWTRGRVTLLGDACHATLPFMAQGAVMAIEDGYILARCLDEMADDVPAALGRYERARRERANRVVTSSSQITRVFHSEDLGEAATAAAYMSDQWQPDRIRQRYDWLFTYDATTAPI